MPGRVWVPSKADPARGARADGVEGAPGGAQTALRSGVLPWMLRRPVLYGVPVLLLLAAIGVGLLVGFSAQRAVDRAASDAFESAARRRVFTLLDRFQTHLRSA
jgi:hypothetical protein